MTFDEFGLLTIKFDNPVSFPTYLIQEALSLHDDYSSSNRRSLNYFADVFYKPSDYKQNVGLNAPPIETKTKSLTALAVKSVSESQDDYEDPVT